MPRVSIEAGDFHHFGEGHSLYANWFQLDLFSVRILTALEIFWAAETGHRYNILTSIDGVEWDRLPAIFEGEFEELTDWIILEVRARYVRIKLTELTSLSDSLYSIDYVNVFGF